MPIFLSDPSSKTYLVLGLLAILLVAIWWLRRARWALVATVLSILAMLGLFLCDKFFESPREEATRKMQEIAAATKAKKMDDAFQHVSESFQFQNMNKKALLARAKEVEGMQMFNGIDVADFERKDSRMLDDHRVQIGFDTWATGYGLPEYRYYCKATFQKDPDGQYRLSTLEFYKNRSADTPAMIPDRLQ